MIEYIPELAEAGIDSFKVEGRMKNALYVATVTRTYRMALDDFHSRPEQYASRRAWYKAEISKCTHRQFSTGFYFGKPREDGQIYDNSTYVNEYIYLGMVEDVAEPGWSPGQEAGENTRKQGTDFRMARFEQRNKFSVGEYLEIMKPDGQNVKARVEALFTEEGEPVDSCPHAREKLWVRLSCSPERYDLLRREA